MEVPKPKVGKMVLLAQKWISWVNTVLISTRILYLIYLWFSVCKYHLVIYNSGSANHIMNVISTCDWLRWYDEVVKIQHYDNERWSSTWWNTLLPNSKRNSPLIGSHCCSTREPIEPNLKLGLALTKITQPFAGMFTDRFNNCSFEDCMSRLKMSRPFLFLSFLKYDR